MSIFKYNEHQIIQLIKRFDIDSDQLLDDIRDYIESTYKQHYVDSKGNQTLDDWAEIDIVEQMCQGTAIKYLKRYGKKDGYNKKDLQKAVHYIVLLWYFTENK